MVATKNLGFGIVAEETAVEIAVVAATVVVAAANMATAAEIVVASMTLLLLWIRILDPTAFTTGMPKSRRSIVVGMAVLSGGGAAT